MILRNSANSVLRTKGRSLLFLLLIAVLTIFLALSSGLLMSADDLLVKCEQEHSTIAMLEYKGDGYPKSDIYDSVAAGMRDSLDGEALSEIEGVLNVDITQTALGSVGGYKRRDDEVVYRRCAVLIVTSVFFTESHYGNTFIGTVVDDIYSYDDYTDNVISITANEIDFQPERNHTYVVCGEFKKGNTGYNNLSMHALFEYGDNNEQPYEDITGRRDEYMQNGTGMFFEIASRIAYYNNSLSIVATSDVENIYLFHQGTAQLKSGRFFTSDEYGKKVCILSERVTDFIGKKVGDFVTLSIYDTGDASVYESYRENGLVEREEYEIVGITNNTPEANTLVFIPKSDRDLGFYGFTLAQLTLDNTVADEAEVQINAAVPDRVAVAVYDQGYAEVKAALLSIGNVARGMTIASSAAAIAVVFIFGYLYIIRQRETVETMRAMGTPNTGVYAYLLISSGIVSLLAVIVGCFGGYASSGAVSAFAQSIAEKAQQKDLLYSNAVIGATKGFVFDFSMPLVNFAIIAAIVLVLSVIVCLLFAALLFRKPGAKKKKVKKKRVIKPRRSSTAGKGALRFAMLSVLRGGLRTAVVPAVSVIMAVFLCYMSFTSASYSAELAALEQNTAIDGSFVGYMGRDISGLAANPTVVAKLRKSGCVTETSMSYNYHYLFDGIAQYADGTEGVVGLVDVPGGEYSYETFVDRFVSQPNIIYSNSLYCTPEFFYAPEVFVNFAEGWDMESFCGAYGENVCILPTTMMEREGISIGDTVSIFSGDMSDPRTSYFYWISLDVVGSFIKQAGKENIYAPLLTDIGDMRNDVYPYFIERVDRPDGTGDEITRIPYPYSPEGKDFKKSYYQQPYTAWLGSLRNAEKLFADSGIVAEFGEGYDLKAFANSVGEKICLIPESLAQEHGITPGDTVTVFSGDLAYWSYSGDLVEYHHSYTVAGTYTGGDKIYFPVGENSPDFSTVRFSLGSAADLEDFKQFLTDEGFSSSKWINTLRVYVMLFDKSYVEAAANIHRHIGLINILYPVMFAAVGLVGFIVSYLLTVGRRMEFAIMRSFGAKGGRTFASFFLEQVLLCLFGALLAAGIWAAVAGFGVTQLLLTGGFVICYLLGSAFSIMSLNRGTALEILTDRD